MKYINFLGTVGITAILVVLMMFTGCKKEEATISGIKISSAAETVKVGSTVKLSYIYEPSDAKPESAVWSSSDQLVASVDQNGVVTGLYEGTATITVKVNDKYTAACTVTVEETVPIYTEGSYSGEGIKIGDTWWAPVNCGYDASHPYGLLYQWGRKYGQAYELGTITPETLSKEDGQKETNKDKFGECDSTTYNWFTGTVDNTLWSGSSKGTYDPCPAGWRVPTESEFTSLTSTKSWITNGGPSSDQNGYLFGTSPNQVFLPAAGYRYHDDGNTYSRGKYGVYWSSSPDSTDSICVRYLDFWASTANMCRGCERAFGYPVRCVHE